MIILNIFLGLILWNMIVASISYKLGLKPDKLYCGQIGFSGKGTFDLNKIKILTLWNSLERGQDSTGIYSPKNGVIRSLERGAACIIHKDYGKLIRDRVLISHFRAATIGSKDNIKNVHPFQEGDWILQHNGTIRNHHDLIKKYDLDKDKINVDSHAICAAIQKTDNIEEILSIIDGPAAIIATNVTKPDTLYVLRNDERPLFRGYINGDMYISSIPGPLELIGCVNIKEFDKDSLYKIRNGAIEGKQKIVNKPYSHPVERKIHNFNNNTTFFENAVFSWVRPKNEYQVMYKDVDNVYSSVMIKPDKYYLVVHVNKADNNYLLVDYDFDGNVENFDILNNKKGEFKAPIFWFNPLDVIDNRSMVVCLTDIKSKFKNQVVFPKGYIVYQCSCWEEGMVNLHSNATTFFEISTSKVNLRTLRDDEYDKLFAVEETIENVQDVLTDKQVEEEHPAINEPNQMIDSKEFDDKTNAGELKDEEIDYFDMLINSNRLNANLKRIKFRIKNLITTSKINNIHKPILDRLNSMEKLIDTLLKDYNIKELQKDEQE